MSDYNPFDKAFDEIQPSDLDILQTVHEGWYVEYKSQVPNASSIAKSISAFANTYGGWLFYGISELSKAEAVAGSFPGIQRSEVDASLQRIRQAVANSINPAPHFDVRVLWGAYNPIGLAPEYGVICVRVPQGHNAPFVHKSGLIYRRVGDGSEPKPENDRFVLDQLWRRGKEIRKEYVRWLETDLELSKGESKDVLYLRLFIVPDLWRDQDVWVNLSTSRVREIMTDVASAQTSFSTIPFDTVYRTSAGFVCRQLINNDPNSLTATWFLRSNLSSEIVIPLPTLRDISKRQIEFELEGYDFGERFARILREQGHEDPTIIDLNFVFTALVGIMHTLSLLNIEAKRTGPMFMKAQLLNVWRACPFLDVESIIQHQSEYRVPVCMSGEIFAPPGKHPDSFAIIPELAETESIALRKAQQAIIAFQPIAYAMGIETGVDDEPDENGKYNLIHASLYGAASRADTAQNKRNERRNRKSN